MNLCAGDMKLPDRIQEAMQMQVEAERKKRASILESEGAANQSSCLLQILALWSVAYMQSIQHSCLFG